MEGKRSDEQVTYKRAFAAEDSDQCSETQTTPALVTMHHLMITIHHHL
jgi:hypothetical protein